MKFDELVHRTCMLPNTTQKREIEAIFIYEQLIIMKNYLHQGNTLLPWQTDLGRAALALTEKNMFTEITIEEAKKSELKHKDLVVKLKGAINEWISRSKAESEIAEKS